MEQKVDFEYAEEFVIFDISFCSTKKEYSFFNLHRKEAEKLVERLQYLKNYSWREFAHLDRENGLTKEKNNTKSFTMIAKQDGRLKRYAGEQYYFHFRVEKRGKFRVFGFQDGKAFCITHIDPKGEIQEKFTINNFRNSEYEFFLRHSCKSSSKNV